MRAIFPDLMNLRKKPELGAAMGYFDAQQTFQIAICYSATHQSG